MLLSAAATAAMVAARIASDTDQTTLAESLRAVEDSRALYGVAGFARFLSGAALLLRRGAAAGRLVPVADVDH